MKLKGIEMQGFKSFADRTKLTFDDGITAIVGPNGSGKSNISDAIKWVFGEQSVKSLRGTKMEDVIFGGTHTRKPMGFAWVSLYIDNTDRSLVGVDADEVVLTRKLYRSGESEYRLNGDPIRLRDLNEAFMDTGLGRDGYSIIEQGKIADIVSAKSGERREIFEEAAGISKFRYRKTEAERRLELSEQNLVRIRDLFGEIESRVGPLRAQAEKARQYQVLAGEKRALELSLWLQKLDELRARGRELEDKLLIATNDRASSDAKVEEIETQLEELHRRTQACSVSVESKRAGIRELEEKISRAAVDTAVKKNDIEHNLASVANLNKEIEAGSASGKDFDQRIAGMEADVEKLRAAIADEEAGAARLRAELESARETSATQQKRVDSLTSQQEELTSSVARAKSSGETSSTLVGETVARLELIRGQTRDKDAALQALRAEQAKNAGFSEELRDKLEGLKNTVDGCRLKLSGRQDALDKLTAQQRQLERAAGEKLQRAQLLSDMEKNMEGMSQSVRAVMKQAASGALRGIIGPLSALIAVDPKHSTAVEIALGPALQNIVTVDEPAAKRAIAMLKSAQVGRATFLPITNIRGNVLSEPQLSGCAGLVGVASELVRCDEKYRGIVDYSLGRTIVAEDLDAAAEISRRFGHRYRVVSLDGQVLNVGGSLTGGYAGKSGSLLSRRTEIETLSAEAKELSSQAAALERQASEIERDRTSVKAILEGAEAEARTANEDLLLAGAEEKRLSMSVADAEKLGETAEKEAAELSARVAELKDKQLSSDQLAAELSARLENVARELAGARQSGSDAAGEAERLSGELGERQVALTAAQKDCESACALLAGVRAQKDDSAARLQELADSVAALMKANADADAEIERINSGASEGENAIAALHQEIESIRAESAQCEQRTEALRQQERSATSVREAAAGEMARLGEQMKNMTAESDGISAKMWDEYQVTRSEAQSEAIELADSAAASRRLGELRGKIRALGVVNPTAIEEYEEVSERYNFYKGQIEDVEKSKAELTKLIADLATQMSTIFESKFVRINEYFGRIFTELFGGGTARLTLTDPELPLETGIDIFVQPPGKIVKNISALSGGEQAFVAICIYFAILRVSPAPFVLVDEIEAALDDVNVNKFAAYMRQMTDHTQFIAVTHRRGTMDEADVLYGVTMEQEGVSKILKLNVAELDEKFKLN